MLLNIIGAMDSNSKVVYQKSFVDQVVPMLSIVLIILYLWGTWPYTTLKRFKIKGPRPLPFVGNFVTICRKGRALADLYWSKKYGKLFGIYEGRTPVVVVKDLDIVKEMLIKDFNFFPNRPPFCLMTSLQQQGMSALKDCNWKEVRRVLTPTFKTENLTHMLPLIMDCYKTMTRRFAEMADTKQDVNVKEHLNAFTLDAIASATFGIQINSYEDISHPFVKNAKKVFQSDAYSLPGLMISFFPFLLPIALKLNITITPKDATDYFAQHIRDILNQHKKSDKVHIDFLQLMLKAHLESGTKDYFINDPIFSDIKVRELTDEEIIAQSFACLISGYKPLATTLSVALYLLSLHPEWQTKLINEAEKILENYNGEISYEALSQMTIVEMVINETLRLYPPVIRMSRIAKNTYKIGNTAIPEDMKVIIPIYAIHHDEKYWPNPEKFDPDRFSSEKSILRHPTSFIPFGVGPRSCIGMQFAKMGSKLALVSILRIFKFSVCSRSQIPLKLKTALKDSSKSGIWLKIERR